MFLEIVSSEAATTQIFQSGIRIWPTCISASGHEIQVFILQARDSLPSHLRHESWQVYYVTGY